MKQDNSKPSIPGQSVYQTGNTDPQKSHRRLYTSLVVVLILLVGVISVMSVLNIRLFRELQELTPESYVFQLAENDDPDTAIAPPPTVPKDIPGAPLQLRLEDAPPAMANIPQEGGLSLQDIYNQNISGIVSVIGNGGSGSGVVISECGYLLTDRHVLGDAQTVKVFFRDGKKLSAQVVGTDPISNLAVLDAEASGLTPIRFGNDATAKVGDAVVAIGDPMGAVLGGTMTDGIIAAINTDLQLGGRQISLLQTTATLNPGNAGGPLMNCHGQVIGIVTTGIDKHLGRSDAEGLSMVIPSSTVKEVVDQLLLHGHVENQASLGFSVEQVSAFDQLYYHVPAGLLITSVAPDVDLKVGDILLNFAGHRVGDTETLQQYLNQYQAGDTVSLVIYRNGENHTVSLTLTEAK